MSIEKSIAEIIENKLKDGTIENAIGTAISESIAKSLDGIFSYAGEGKKLIDEKLKKIMVPAIEQYDFNQHLVKLDTILTEIVNTTGVQENKKIIENFKSLMIEDELKEIKLSEIFEKWCDFVGSNVGTSNLDVVVDDGVYYESVEVEMNVELIENRYSHAADKKIVYFTCDSDDSVNIQFEVYKYSFMKGYEINDNIGIELKSIRHLNEMQILLARLARSSTNVVIDSEFAREDITPDAEPEVTFN